MINIDLHMKLFRADAIQLCSGCLAKKEQKARNWPEPYFEWFCEINWIANNEEELIDYGAHAAGSSAEEAFFNAIKEFVEKWETKNFFSEEERKEFYSRGLAPNLLKNVFPDIGFK